MADSARNYLLKAGVKAIATAAYADPLCGVCGFVISGILATEPGKKLAEKLGEQLTEAAAEKLFDEAAEIEKGGLPDAILQSLRESLRATSQEQWSRWFDNWEKACKQVRAHHWKDSAGLARAIGLLQVEPGNPFLIETLELLDLSARLAGSAHANPEHLPPELAAYLNQHLPAAFISTITKLLGKAEYLPANSELTVAGVALATAPRTANAPAPLTGPDDERIAPRRGFFTGRVPQLRDLLAFLRGADSILLVTGQIYSVRGAPGIGKTELCKAALRAFLGERPETRAYYADVTGKPGADGLRSATAEALGDRQLAEHPHRLHAALVQHADLLYLDNLEDAIGEDREAGAAFEWLGQLAASRVKILASSRRGLGDLAHEYPLGPLDADAAEALFRRYWTLVGGEPVTDEPGFRHFLEHDLDHHALTIRLVAAQAGEARTWQGLRDLWRKHCTRLAEVAGVKDRIHSLDASLALSIERVKSSIAARDLWIAMACFPEGLSPSALAAILPDEAVAREAVNLLTRLSLIDRAGDRWTMLAPLREYAAALPAAEVEPVWVRCLAYFGALAAVAKSTELGTGEGRAPAVQALLAEFPNLADAMVRASSRPGLIDLTGSIHHALLNSYQLTAPSARTLLRHLLPAFLASGHRRHAASAARYLGDLESWTGDVAGARARYQEALKLYESEQDNLGRANTLQSLGDLESRTGDVAGARARYQEALKLYESEQANLGRANTLQSLGDLALSHDGDTATAFGFFTEAARLFTAEQDANGFAQVCARLAILWKAAGRDAEAAEDARRARQAAAASGLPPLIDWVESALSRVGL